MTSKKALEGALESVRAEVRAAGGKADVATPDFQDVADPQTADFKKFADAVSELARRSPDLSADRLARAAITGMIRQSPDCHTYFFDGRSRIDSRPVRSTGDPRPAAPSGQVLQQPDEAGLTGRILDGGVAYIRWTEFRLNGTYDIKAKVKDLVTRALAAGAKAWLFDVRGNSGGNGADSIASFFLNGEPLMRIDERVGNPTIKAANKDLRLPEAYQLPIALIQNDQGGSDPEIFALFLKEARRATIVGGKSIGCVGSTSPTALRDGTTFFVVSEEYTGAASGARYNNAGIPPDVAASDAQAIDVAAKLLRDQIAKR